MNSKAKIKLVVSIAIAVYSLAGCGQRSSTNSSTQSGNQTTGNNVRTENLKNKISTGKRLLLNKNSNKHKIAAAEAYAYSDYNRAISEWENSLKQQRNDPESLIYLNNARIGTNPSHTIAVPIPIDAEINVAKEILRGAAQAQYEINRNGGIKGTPLKLAIANDRNNPDTAKALATLFSQNSEILGIVGHFSSNVTLEAAQVYQNKGLVVVSPTSSTTALSNVGSYVFRTVSSDCFAGSALAEYMVEQIGVKQAAVVYNSASSYSASIRDVFENSLDKNGGAVVAEFNFNQPNFDIANVLATAKAKNAQAIALFPNSSGQNASEALDKTLLIATLNQGELFLLGGDSLYKPRVLQLGQQNVVDLVVSVPGQISSQNSQFIDTAKELWGGRVNWRTSLSYDATVALAKVIEIDPTRTGVRQALLAPEFTAQGASKPIEFLPTGDRAGEVELVRVAKGNSSGFGYDFVPIPNDSNSAANTCN